MGHKLSLNPIASNWSSWNELRLIDGLAQHGLAWDAVANVVAVMNSNECEKHFFTSILPPLSLNFQPCTYTYTASAMTQVQSEVELSLLAPPVALSMANADSSVIEETRKAWGCYGINELDNEDFTLLAALLRGEKLTNAIQGRRKMIVSKVESKGDHDDEDTKEGASIIEEGDGTVCESFRKVKRTKGYVHTLTPQETSLEVIRLRNCNEGLMQTVQLLEAKLVQVMLERDEALKRCTMRTS